MNKKSSKDNSQRILKLVGTLRETEQELQELTGGELDAVTVSGGQPYLLRESQAKLRQSETAQRRFAEEQVAILNALAPHIALVDSEGVITAVNKAWKRFAGENELPDAAYGIGQNYFAVCEQGLGLRAEDGLAVADGLRQVLGGRTNYFAHEYPCHTPHERRWFRLVITPLHEDHRGAVILHVNITESQLAMEKLAQSAALMRMAGRLTRTGGWSMETSDRQVRWSDEICEIMECAPGHALALDAALTLHPSPSRDEITAAMETCMRDGTPFDIEVKIFTIKGRQIWGRVCGEAERNADGVIQRVWGAFQDITKRKEEELVLRLSEEGFQQISEQLIKILDSTLDTICTIDAEGRFIQISAACKKMWGYRPDEMIGKPYIGFVHPEDHAGTNQIAAEIIAGKPTVNFENRYIRKDGSISHLIWSASWSEADRSMFAVARDNSERHKSQEQLLLLQTCIERLNDVVIICSADDFDEHDGPRIIYVNPAFEKLTGFTNAEAIGKSPPELLHGRKTDPAEAKRILNALKNKKPVRAELFHYTKSGKQYWNEINVVPILSPAGVMTHVVSVERDKTEALQTRERLTEQAAVIEQAHDAIYVSDLDKCILFWNASAERIYGWAAHEVAGNRIEEMLKLDPAELHEAEQILLQNGEWMGELQKTNKAGDRLTLDCRWTLLRDRENRPRSYLYIETDITEHKKIELQFLRAQRMESIGTLAGGVAHDLNNVLAPIMMSVELLKEKLNDEEGISLLETLDASALRAAELVKQVLSFARGVEGKRVDVNPYHILTDIQNIIRDTFPKSITFNIERQKEVWSVTGDPTQLHQVFLNLCVNARDAMPNGGMLTAKLENVVLDENYAGMNPETKPGSYVVVTITDTGTGIPPAILDRIFEPFYTTKEIGKGTGLGLSTTLAIVKGHGGFVNVYSEPGKGSRFKIYLPAITTAESSENVAVEATKLPRGNGELILVVDDEEAIRGIAKKTLERFGYRVMLATNGAEGVALYAKHPSEIAVVLTDMAMPVMDGPAMIVALRSIDPHVKIIGSSGLASSGGIAKALGAGVEHFINKPYTAETILGTLRKMLDGKV